MIEVLFRGKNVITKEFVYGSLVYPIVGAKPIIIRNAECDDSGEVDFDEMYFVQPETVGQYTGLLDKNGTKIFENDILMESKDMNGDWLDIDSFFVVKFGICGGVKNIDTDVGFQGFYLEGYDEKTKNAMSLGLRNDIVYYLNNSNLQVVGNIFDGVDRAKVKYLEE